MNEHMLIVVPNGDDVVVPQRAIFDQQDERMPGIELFANRRDRAVEPLHLPSTRTNGIDEGGFGNPTRSRVDEGLKLLNVGVAIAPVAKHHGRRRSAAERLGLREERNGHREKGRQE
jgi:hypothetical protein